MTKRTLVLRRRQLTELTSEDLRDVNGAAIPPTRGCPVHTEIRECVTQIVDTVLCV